MYFNKIKTIGKINSENYFYYDDTNSYFNTQFTVYDTDIDGLQTVSHNHKRYVSEKFTDDPIMTRIQRTKYIDSVNEWLLTPLYNDNYINNEYVGFNDFIDYLDMYNKNDEDCENNDEYECVDDDTPENDPVTNQTMGKAMYNEITKAIYDSGFEIDDSKQFKEDFIHFIYTLSELKT